MTEERSLLSRWAARKRAVAAEAAEPAPAQTDAAAADAQRAENRAAAEAVDLEALDKDSDLSVFLREGVPDLLRNAALQKVWRSNPIFANLDDLVDYGEDYGRKDLIMESFKSAWQAGRGYLREIEEVSARAEEAAETQAPEPTPTQLETPPAASDPAPPEPVASDAQETAPAAPQPPRRASLRARLSTDSGDA